MLLWKAVMDSYTPHLIASSPWHILYWCAYPIGFNLFIHVFSSRCSLDTTVHFIMFPWNTTVGKTTWLVTNRNLVNTFLFRLSSHFFKKSYLTNFTTRVWIIWKVSRTLFQYALLGRKGREDKKIHIYGISYLYQIPSKSWPIMYYFIWFGLTSLFLRHSLTL